MTPHLRYLWYVGRHKWHVFVGCLVLGVPLWRAVTHDLSKFSRAEWGPYVAMFFGDSPLTPHEKARFADAWQHHWTHNPHHWNYWLSPAADDDTRTARPMPEIYVREMIADWYGVGMAMGKPDITGWYEQGKAQRQLHPDTHAAVERVMREARQKRLFL